MKKKKKKKKKKKMKKSEISKSGGETYRKNEGENAGDSTVVTEMKLVINEGSWRISEKSSRRKQRVA